MSKYLRVKIKRLLQHSWIGAGLHTLLNTAALGQTDQIEEVLVLGESQSDYRVNELSQSKFTESLKKTPQSISTLSRELLEDRAAMSLNDALRNVPGITLGAGEFSWQGNNPSLRGFSSRNDMFMDGMRDFGSYYRDPFNLESIEVLQGPSSVIFGRGSTGGVINQVSKTPAPDPLRRLHINAGNADTQRVTADLSQPVSLLNRSGAIRLNLLGHRGDFPGRDGAYTERYGIAPSIRFSPSERSELILSHLHQHGDSIPDYGLPWIEGRPANVPRESYYGFIDDFVDTETDVTTITFNHQSNEALRFNAMVRHANYMRSTRISEPQLVDPTLGDSTATVRRFVFRGESVERMLQGQLNVISQFQTGSIGHTFVAGIESGNEFSSPEFGFGTGVPNTTLLNPAVEKFSGSTPVHLASDTDARSAAVYFLDTLQLNDQWQLMAGLRRDRFFTDYRENRFQAEGTASTQSQVQSKDIETSYRLALIFSPQESGSLYLSIGNSFNPSTEGLSQISSGRNLTISNLNLQPEENRSAELGTKWELADGQLLLDAALFQIEKTNARVPDPANPGFNILAGKQEVEGFSINLNGRLNNRLQLAGGYTYLNSSQAVSSQVNVPADSPLQNVAENNFSFWIYYDTPLGLQVGAGARFVDDRLATITLPSNSVSDYWSFDAMAKYQWSKNLSFKINLTNLADEYYFDQLHPWHVVPGPGFASVFAINLDY